MPFFVHVEGEHSGDGAIVSYWHGGESLGAALADAVRHARDTLSLTNARGESVEAALDDEAPPPDTIPTASDQLRQFEPINLWPLSPDDPGFWFPTGVIPGTPEQGISPSEIQEGYAIHRLGTDHALELVVDGRRLREVFTRLIAALPSCDGLEVRLLAHWEEQTSTQVLLAPPNLVERALSSFMEEHVRDLVDNGGVEIGIYARREHCTLRLTDHKTIWFYSAQESDVPTFERVALDLGFPRVENLVSIAQNCAHYHYAPQGALSRAALEHQLKQHAFRLVDEWTEDDGP